MQKSTSPISNDSKILSLLLSSPKSKSKHCAYKSSIARNNGNQTSSKKPTKSFNLEDKCRKFSQRDGCHWLSRLFDHLDHSQRDHNIFWSIKSLDKPGMIEPFSCVVPSLYPVITVLSLWYFNTYKTLFHELARTSARSWWITIITNKNFHY